MSVRRTQQSAFEAVRPGVPWKEIDRAGALAIGIDWPRRFAAFPPWVAAA